MIPERRAEPAGMARDVEIEAGGVPLQGTLTVPKGAREIVLFAHGSGSSRRSPRNRYVAGVLQENGIATLLFDLLTQREEVIDEQTAELRFDIPLLAKRLRDTTLSIQHAPHTSGLSVGYFGASTGAAAALVAAAELPESVSAIVSRGGRPDLAGRALASVQAPTLLLVGGNDDVVIELNRQALEELGSKEKELIIIPGATHLFEEPGTLEEVAHLASEWFLRFNHIRRKARTETRG